METRVADENRARTLPAWQDRITDPIIAREPSADGKEVALWIPNGGDRDCRFVVDEVKVENDDHAPVDAREGCRLANFSGILLVGVEALVWRGTPPAH